jgi:hypothetical protein
MINVGCVHYHQPHYHGHCAEMLCRNYVNKCPLHSITGSTTATCNLERAKALVGMTQETKDLAVKIIELNPAMEESILFLVELVARDAEENAEP